jgi:membrane protein YqaA with SNARE-associated domain
MLRPIIRTVGRTLFHMGGWGIFTLSTLDSSPLFLPFGNDLLVLALCARYRDRMFYYVAMATLGSLIGCLATDWISRKGQKGLKKFLPGKRLASIRTFVKEHAAWTLAISSILPPPFPFTGIVAGAAAFGYPRKKLFTVIAGGRFLRFFIEGALAVHYGRWIVRQAESPLLEHVMLGLLVISIAGSAITIYRWNHERESGERE